MQLILIVLAVILHIIVSLLQIVVHAMIIILQMVCNVNLVIILVIFAPIQQILHALQAAVLLITEHCLEILVSVMMATMIVE